jgi:hypothetical protein
MILLYEDIETRLRRHEYARIRRACRRAVILAGFIGVLGLIAWRLA